MIQFFYSYSFHFEHFFICKLMKTTAAHRKFTIISANFNGSSVAESLFITSSFSTSSFFPVMHDSSFFVIEFLFQTLTQLTCCQQVKGFCQPHETKVWCSAVVFLTSLSLAWNYCCCSKTPVFLSPVQFLCPYRNGLPRDSVNEIFPEDFFLESNVVFAKMCKRFIAWISIMCSFLSSFCSRDSLHAQSSF